MKTAHKTLVIATLFVISGVVGFLAPSGKAKANNPTYIRIHYAHYGYTQNCGTDRDTWGNVYQHVSTTCDGREYCEYNVDVNTLGDPCWGTQKDLKVMYSCETWDLITRLYDEVTVPAEAHGRSFIIECPPEY